MRGINLAELGINKGININQEEYFFHFRNGRSSIKCREESIFDAVVFLLLLNYTFPYLFSLWFLNGSEDSLQSGTVPLDKSQPYILKEINIRGRNKDNFDVNVVSRNFRGNLQQKQFCWKVTVIELR